MVFHGNDSKGIAEAGNRKGRDEQHGRRHDGKRKDRGQKRAAQDVPGGVYHPQYPSELHECGHQRVVALRLRTAQYREFVDREGTEPGRVQIAARRLE